jgi:hypothetical protein
MCSCVERSFVRFFEPLVEFSAIGEPPASIARMIITRGLRLVAAGLVIGIAATYPLTLAVRGGAAPLLLALAQEAEPPRTDQDLVAELRQHATPIGVTDGHLVGTGAEWLRATAARAQFVFIGEEHDVREVPMFAGALWRDLVPLGYRHVAIEAGQWLGGRLDRFARFDDHEALRQFLAATWPRLPNNSVPPISQEDVEFYRDLGKAAGPHAASDLPLIWGLDDEFRATPLLQRLAALAGSAGARRRVDAIGAPILAAEAEGSRGLTPFRADIETLAGVIPATPGSERFQILDALRRRATRAPGAPRPMKDLFVRNYASAKAHGEARPRVMLRFGGYHAGRGLMRDFGTSTLGNYVAELAVTEGTEMFNILLLLCTDAAAPPDRAPDVYERPCSAEEQQWRKPLQAAAVAPWTLFDLRAMRPRFRRVTPEAGVWPPGDAAYRELVNMYDAAILITPTHRSTIIRANAEPAYAPVRCR